jgi:hypothetical protein
MTELRRGEVPLDAAALIARLGLAPHPREGGYFVETYRSDERITRGALPARYGAERTLGTAIYYLLTPSTFSEMHCLASDEIFHFYLGDPVEMLLLRADGSGEEFVLGTEIAAGMRPQLVVPCGVWQGARLRAEGRFALLGTTVAPGFEYADFETGARAELLAAYPAHAPMILALTRVVV